MRSILIVEDSPEYQKVIARALGSYKLTCVNSAEDAWATLGRDLFDLVLLDISLPQRDGYSLLGDMQSTPALNMVPIICLTGKKNVTDKLMAFNLGADDYLEKPFDPLELKARIDSKILKNNRLRESQDILTVGEIKIDRKAHRAVISLKTGELEVHLTQTEFKLLFQLASRPDQVFTRDQLIVSAWGQNADVLDRAVDVHLCSMRKKLGPVGKRIEAIPGVGYRLSLERFPIQSK